jgi:hypothetical protein
MAAAFILQSFRSRAALAPTGAVFCRPSFVPVMARRRHYSDETPKVDVEDASKVVLTPDQEKLKEKEAEVIDLTVGVLNGDRDSRSIYKCLQITIEPPTLSPSRLS